jgi:fibronectin type 3 domain-containing protein
MKQFIPLTIFTLLVLLLNGCSNPAAKDAPTADPTDKSSKTYVQFVNSNDFAVTIYRTDAKVGEIAALKPRTTSAAIETEAAPEGVNYYPIYYIIIDDIPIPYNGMAIIARIDKEKTTRVIVPLLSDYPDEEKAEVITTDVYIKIQNNSVYSMLLVHNHIEERPVGSSSTIVMPGELTYYITNASDVSSYQLMKNTNIPIPFPDVNDTSTFVAGHLYSFTYDGTALTLLADGVLSIDSALANALPSPDGITAQALSESSIRISWNAVSGASGYNVYRASSEEGTYAKVNAATITGTDYTDTGLTRGETYYYKVTSLNIIGEGEKSDYVIGSVRGPDAPQGLKADLVSASSIKLEWDAVDGVIEYKVYRSTTDSDDAYTEQASVTDTEWTDTGLNLDTIYYYKVAALNGIGQTMSEPVEAKITPPQAPETPVISTANGEITVSWQAVEGASAYEVYIGTSDDSANAEKDGSDISGPLSKTISGLANGTTYYLWIKAKNILGTSDFSPMASGKPLGTPEAPTVIAGASQLTVTWAAVAGADEYEVYCDTSSAPTTLSATVIGTTATITDLMDSTLYYVRLKAKNATGTSVYGGTASGRTSILPGLYDNVIDATHKIGNQNLMDALSHLATSAENGHEYFIVLGANESVAGSTLSYSGKTVGITLMGTGVERTISLSTYGSLFTVETGVTLTLDDKITLVGRGYNTSSLVSVSGTLVMNEGSKITGNAFSSSGYYASGGVYINRGTFNMQGGTISGNIASSSLYGGGGVFVEGGTFTMQGGTISGNTASSSYGGGGVHVNSGTFTMQGGTINGNTASYGGGGVHISGGTFSMEEGTISGNTASSYGGGVYVSGGTFGKAPGVDGRNSGITYGSDADGNDANGVPLKNTAIYAGSAVYDGSSGKNRNTTAGQTDYINTATGLGLSASGEAPFGE